MSQLPPLHFAYKSQKTGSDGWTATVNGEKVDVEKVNAGFMAVLVPAGRSTIRFEYTTPGLSNGITITIVALVILVIYAIVCLILSRKKNQTEIEYPEGDLLMIKWKMQEIQEAKAFESIENEDRASLFDSVEASENIDISGTFEGGFKINTDFFDDK